MQRIFLIDERIDGAEPDAVARLAAETTEADVMMRFSATTSLVKTIPQVRGAWQMKYPHPSSGLYIAARSAMGRLLFGSEGLSATNMNLLVSLRGFAGGRVVLWGCDAGAWAPAAAAPTPQPVAEAGLQPAEGEEPPLPRSTPANSGHAFLRAIAQTLGLPVFANVHPQFSRTTWRIVGRHVVVQPNGDFSLSDAIE